MGQLLFRPEIHRSMAFLTQGRGAVFRAFHADPTGDGRLYVPVEKLLPPVPLSGGDLPSFPLSELNAPQVGQNIRAIIEASFFYVATTLLGSIIGGRTLSPPYAPRTETEGEKEALWTVQGGFPSGRISSLAYFGGRMPIPDVDSWGLKVISYDSSPDHQWVAFGDREGRSLVLDTKGERTKILVGWENEEGEALYVRAAIQGGKPIRFGCSFRLPLAILSQIEGLKSILQGPSPSEDDLLIGFLNLFAGEDQFPPHEVGVNPSIVREGEEINFRKQFEWDRWDVGSPKVAFLTQDRNYPYAVAGMDSRFIVIKLFKPPTSVMPNELKLVGPATQVWTQVQQMISAQVVKE